MFNHENRINGGLSANISSTQVKYKTDGHAKKQTQTHIRNVMMMKKDIYENETEEKKQQWQCFDFNSIEIGAEIYNTIAQYYNRIL